MGRELYNSRSDDGGDGFTFTYETSGGRWPKVVLYGDEGEVVCFGLGEIRALAEASAKALVLAEAVEADQVSRAA